LFNYPDFLILDDKQVRFNTDFRNWIKILIVGDDEQLTDSQTMAFQFRLAFSDWDTKEFRDEVIKNPLPYYDIMKKFLIREKEKEQDNKSSTERKTFDWEQDWDYITSAFKQQYNLDLEVDKVHWYKFMAMFNSLDAETQFSKIIGYRAINLSDIKDKKMREFYGKMKDQYRIKDKWDSIEREETSIWIPQEVIDARQNEKGVNNEL
jgi:hypothetical protein